MYGTTEIEIQKCNIVSEVGQADSEAYTNPRKLNARLEARGNNVRVEISKRDDSDNMNMIFLWRHIDNFQMELLASIGMSVMANTAWNAACTISIQDPNSQFYIVIFSS